MARSKVQRGLHVRVYPNLVGIKRDGPAMRAVCEEIEKQIARHVDYHPQTLIDYDEEYWACDYCGDSQDYPNCCDAAQQAEAALVAQEPQ